MSTRASHFKIGVFVLATVAVLIAGIIVLSAGALRGERVMLETYIDESVQGLSVGSAVMQRGVQIGRVTKITFVPREYKVSPSPKKFSEFSKYVMVIMSIERDHLPGETDPELRDALADAVRNGFRLKLSSQGITGITYIEADFVDPERHPAMKLDWQPKRLYIPSMASTLASFTQSVDHVLRTLEQVDLVGITQNLDKAIRSLNDAVEGAKVARIEKEFVALASELRRTNKLVMGFVDGTKVDAEFRHKTDLITVVQSMDKALSTLSREVQAAQIGKMREDAAALVADIRRTNQLVQRLLEKVEGDPKTGGVPETVAQLNKTLKRMEQFMSGRQAQIDAILANVGKATANLAKLTESAKKYPSQVLFGNPPPRSEKVQ
ncbi:MAG: MlaD family protein [Planctomycetota bacterium]